MLIFVGAVIFFGHWRRLFHCFGRTCDACDVCRLALFSYRRDLLTELLNRGSHECIFLLERVYFVVSMWLPVILFAIRFA